MRVVSESKIKKCKMPKCNKEVHKNKALFCLQHKREIKEYSNQAGKGILTLGGLAVTLVGKNLLKKKM